MLLVCQCGCTRFYITEHRELECSSCGTYHSLAVADRFTPYPGNATREQWVQEVAAKIRAAIYSQSTYGMDDKAVVSSAEAFVAACDQHFGREVEP
jgi:hypothetical protein